MNQTDNHAVAQAVHDLGAAMWFGGSVMGIGVNQSGRDISQGIDRIRAPQSVWRRFGPMEWAGIAATMLAGMQLTRASSGRLAMQRSFGSVGAMKAGVVALGALATAYATYCGNRISSLAEKQQEQGEKVEVTDATTPAPSTSEQIATWQRRHRVAQYTVPVLAGSNIVFGSYLVQSYRPGSTIRGMMRRLMPD
jgi:uncharacterized membrane protein